MENEKQVAGGRYDEFKSGQEYAELNVEAQAAEAFPTKIERTDLKPHPIDKGETEIVAQRHGRYVRERDDARVGSLTEEAVADEKAEARAYFESLLAQIPEDERDTVDVLFVASDTQYFDGGRRSLETGSLALEAATEVFGEQGIPTSNIHNARRELKGDGAPRTMQELREPNMLNDSPDFLQYMLDKYGGVNLDFWTAFEEDKEVEKRLETGAEGPDDIADRMHHSMDVLARYAKFYHHEHPNRRLVIWAATHYDTISPFVKRDVFGVGKEQQLLVDYGAGITIDVDKEGNATTEISGKQYSVPLKK